MMMEVVASEDAVTMMMTMNELINEIQTDYEKKRKGLRC